MVRYMSRIRWQDRIFNQKKTDVAWRALKIDFWKMRLRCFGHVKCRDENSIIRRAMKLEVEGRRPVGMLQKTWSKVVEDMRKLNITEDLYIWQRIENSGSNSYHVQPQEWETSYRYVKCLNLISCYINTYRPKTQDQRRKIIKIQNMLICI